LIKAIDKLTAETTAARLATEMNTVAVKELKEAVLKAASGIDRFGPNL
jgi:hypothetical protein